MSPLRRGLRSPPPAHTRQSGVYTQTAGRGRRRLTPRGGDARGAAGHPSPLHAAPPSLLTPAPQPPNSTKPNSQCHPDEGLGPPIVFYRQWREIPSSDARSPGRLLQSHPGSGTRPSGSPDLRRRPSHRPLPALPDDRRPGRSPARHPEEPEPEPTHGCSGHSPPQASFSEPVNLTPNPPGGPIPQAQLHRGDRNNKNANRITTAGNVQSCNRNRCTDPVSSSAPIPRAPRGPRAHRGRREGAACLDDRHPRARGDGRAHTRPLPQTQSVTRGGRGGVETLSRGPSGSRECSSLRPGAALPTSAERSQNSCKFGWY